MRRATASDCLNPVVVVLIEVEDGSSSRSASSIAWIDLNSSTILVGSVWLSIVVPSTRVCRSLPILLTSLTIHVSSVLEMLTLIQDVRYEGLPDCGGVGGVAEDEAELEVEIVSV